MLKPTRGFWFNDPVPYRRALALQEALHQARLLGVIPDTVLLLEHLPVVTLGNRGRREALRLDPEAYASRGIELIHASRGGDVTYHGPGQLVLYPVLHLGAREADTHGYLFNLEEAALRTAARFGVEAFRREGKNGAWTTRGKLAAIGFRIKRWVTMHGMSFNVRVDLAGFETIVPCGLQGEKVTSLEHLLGSACPSTTEVGEELGRQFEAACGRETLWAQAPENLTPEQLVHLAKASV